MTKLSRRILIRQSIGAAACYAAFGTAQGFGQSSAAPDVIVREFYDVLLSSMRKARDLGFSGRYALLDPAVRKTFDLAAMTRISIGPQWRQIDAAIQTKLLAVFAEWTIATYADQFNGIDGEVFSVGATKDSGADKLVETVLTPKGAEPVILNYLMRQTNGEWRVIDVYLTGTISELATRRSEFTAIIKTDGAEGVVRALSKRVDEMRSKKTPK